MASSNSGVAFPAASAAASSSKYASIAAGEKRTSFLPGTAETTLKVCGVSRGTYTKVPGGQSCWRSSTYIRYSPSNTYNASAVSRWRCRGGPNSGGSPWTCSSVNSLEVWAALARTSASKLPKSKYRPSPEPTINASFINDLLLAMERGMQQPGTPSLPCDGDLRRSVLGGQSRNAQRLSDRRGTRVLLYF